MVNPKGKASEPEVMEQTAADRVSLLTLANTAIGMEQDARDDHCYAFNEEKCCLEGREKDHNYSTNSKTWFMGHRKTQSFSELNIHSSEESEKDFLNNETSPLYLPHYQSNDSALDVTGFDSISRKCISYENIDLKTVDVLTEKRILLGISDPDISRMTLGSNLELNTQPVSVSMPNSPPLGELRTTIEHNYSKENLFERLWNLKPMKEHQNMSDILLDRSPLFDHSYDSNKLKHENISSRTTCEQNIKKVDKIYKASSYSHTFTKSPFLDHTYQSVNKKSNKHLNVSWKKETILSSDRVFPKPPFLDHSYNTVIESDEQMEIFSPVFVRNRSSSVSVCVPFQDDSRADHSYVIKDKDDALSMSFGSGSGTESFTEEVDDVPASFGSLVSLQKDHPYVTHI